MQTEISRRGFPSYVEQGNHLRLNYLKMLNQELNNRYLWNDIAQCPQPEFYTTRVKHDTNRSGLRSIRMDGGFKDPVTQPESDEIPLVWWSLVVGPEEIRSAEKKLLEKTFPDRTEEQAAMQESFLWKFATSPAFSETSRLGSYRFTFSLKEVLKAYSEQFCSGAEPVMRVYKTNLFKAEVMHTVLVHSPANEALFSQFPLLSDAQNAVCVYRDCCCTFIWRPEAMCQTHRYELIRCAGNQMRTRRVNCHYYVWDHVAIALHVENQQVLKFPAGRLRENLRYCWPGPVTYGGDKDFDDFENAKKLAHHLWPGCDSPLDEEPSLQQSFAVSNIRLILVGGKLEGKSSSADTILDTKVFTRRSVSSAGASSGTTRCWRQSGEASDRVVTIVDTPGLSKESNTETKREISRAMKMLAPGPHAILLVMKLGSIEIQDVVKQVREIFGEDLWRYTIILFTHTGPYIQKRLEGVGPELQELLQMVENRYHILNNHKGYYRDEVLALLTMVEKMVVANGGQFYSSWGRNTRMYSQCR